MVRKAKKYEERLALLKFWRKRTKPELLHEFRKNGAKRYSHLNKEELVKNLVAIETRKRTWEQFSRTASPRNRTRKPCPEYKNNSPKCKGRGKLTRTELKKGGDSFRKGTQTVYFNRRLKPPKLCIFCQSPSGKAKKASHTRRTTTGGKMLARKMYAQKQIMLKTGK